MVFVSSWSGEGGQPGDKPLRGVPSQGCGGHSTRCIIQGGQRTIRRGVRLVALKGKRTNDQKGGTKVIIGREARGIRKKKDVQSVNASSLEG